jgi:outer membrane protein TolC
MQDIPFNFAKLETEIAHHPQITVLDKQVDIAKADAKLARADKSADWSVELAYQQRGAAFSDMISVGISVPLQWDKKNRQDRALYAKLAQVDKASAERDEQLKQHVAETRMLVNAWQTNRQRCERFELELIPLAQARIKALTAAYRGGKARLSDVLAARRNHIDIRLQSIQLQSDTARLWAQLNFLAPMNGDTVNEK